MVTIRIPAPPQGLASNLLGLAGLIAVVVAIGGLAGVWWAILAGGVVAVGLSWLAQVNTERAKQSAEAPTEPMQLRPAASRTA